MKSGWIEAARLAGAALILAIAMLCAGCASRPVAPVPPAPVVEDEVPPGVTPLTREVEEIGNP